MTSSQSRFSGTLDFEITDVNCMFQLALQMIIYPI